MCLQQYWADRTRPYEFVPVEAFASAFEASPTGRGNAAAVAQPFQRGPEDSLDALVRTKYALFHRCSTCGLQSWLPTVGSSMAPGKLWVHLEVSKCVHFMQRSPWYI